MQPNQKKPIPKKPIPKRALPNKPLPSKPLPSKPIPQQQQQPIPNNTQYIQPDENASEPQSQSHPEPEPEPQVQPQQQEPQESDSKNTETAPETEATNNNWYKPKVTNKKSYQSAKTCKLLLDDKKNKMKKVKLFATYDKFFVAEGNSKNRGFQVASICNNEFGKAFSKMGIISGWRVIKFGNKPLQNISFAMLKNQLISQGQKAGDKGYYLMFDGNPQKEQKEDDIPQLNIEPVSVGKNSVELISSYNDHKIVKIKNSIDKYIDFESVKGPKGYKISSFKAKFGNDLKQYGIDVNWRVIKLGDKDVSNMFTQMIKTNLDVEWKKNKDNGIIVTFGQPI